jgi:hypothetical protein
MAQNTELNQQTKKFLSSLTSLDVFKGALPPTGLEKLLLNVNLLAKTLSIKEYFKNNNLYMPRKSSQVKT